MLFSWNLKTLLKTVFTFMTILMIFGRTGLVSFKQVLDEHAPVKRVQLRNNQLPWISLDIQKQIRIVST